jgi:glycosyl transferase, family 25
MPPIRFINLDRDVERRQRLETELQRHAVVGERFPGVWWPSLSEEQQARYYSPVLNARQHHLPLVNGEKGCYASHIELWRWLVESSHETLVVLEDDVCLLPDFAAVCQAVATTTGQPWDMVKLIGREGLGKTEKLATSDRLSPGHALVRYRRVPSLTAGYVLHRRGADKLLRHRLPFGRPIDVDLRHWWECEDLHVLGVRPAVIALDETSEQSSINADLKRLPPSQRWRKFLFKAQYSLANAWHRPKNPSA